MTIINIYYRLVNLYITMENHIFNGKTHSKTVIFNSYLKLPEGIFLGTCEVSLPRPRSARVVASSTGSITLVGEP